MTTTRIKDFTQLVATAPTYIAVDGETDGTRKLLYNLAGSAAPTVTDDSDAGYSVGSHWIYGTALYVCTDATVGAAVWTQATQVQPFGAFEGSGPSVTFANAGIDASAPIIRTPSGDANGDYTITLAAAVTGTIATFPSPSNGKYPIAFVNDTTLRCSASIVGSSFPYTQVRVRIKDDAGVATDSYFSMMLIAF